MTTVWMAPIKANENFENSVSFLWEHSTISLPSNRVVQRERERELRDETIALPRARQTPYYRRI